MRPEYISLIIIAALSISRLQNGNEATPFLTYLAVLIGAIWLQKLRERHRRDFIHQLKSCRKELRSGGTVVINSHLVRYNSTISTYYMNFGSLFCTVRVPSLYRVVDAGDEHHDSSIYSLVSILTGWWAIPGGPLQTVATIISNISGGERLTVAELIDLPLIKKINQRRSDIEAYEMATLTEAQNVRPEIQIADAGPKSRINQELLRGSRQFNRVQSYAASNQRQTSDLLDDRPPGEVWISAARAKMSALAEELVEQYQHSKSQRTKHAKLTHRMMEQGPPKA